MPRPLTTIPPITFGLEICKYLEPKDIRNLFQLKIAKRKKLKRFYCPKHFVPLQTPSDEDLQNELKEEEWPEDVNMPDYGPYKQRCQQCRFELRRIPCDFGCKSTCIEGKSNECSELIHRHLANTKVCCNCSKKYSFCTQNHHELFCCAGDRCREENTSWTCPDCSSSFAFETGDYCEYFDESFAYWELFQWPFEESRRSSLHLHGVGRTEDDPANKMRLCVHHSNGITNRFCHPSCARESCHYCPEASCVDGFYFRNTVMNLHGNNDRMVCRSCFNGYVLNPY